MSQEYSIYIDSYNREKKLDSDPNSQNNPTNDIIIPVKMPTGRLPVAELNLGSLELPLAQYTVEDNWKNFFFDEGLDLIVQDDANMALTQFIINENGTDILAQLPQSQNPVIDVQADGLTYTFTTLYPHGLEIMDAYTWGDPIRLISTPIVDPDLYTLSSSNTNLTILSETEFSITLPGALTFSAPAGVFGYVWAPTIPNPAILASLVTAALNVAAPNHWRVTYDTASGRFKLCWINSGCDYRTASPAFLIIPGTDSLPSLMGFGQVNINIPMPVVETKQPTEFDLILARDRILEPKDNCLVALNCYQCKSHISIDPGNYSANDLGANMSRQWNRFYFDQGCDADPESVAAELVFSNSCGSCFTVQVPYGKYTPDGLAAQLQAGMIALVPGGNFSVTWNNEAGTFVISCDITFSLEWDKTTKSQDLAYRMGFLPVPYRNQTIYESSRPFYVPTKGCCPTSIPERFTSYVYMPFVLGTERKFSIERSKPRAQLTTVEGLTYNGNGTATIVTDFAHGFQPYDIVQFTFPTAGAPTQPPSGPGPYYFRVISNDAYDTFTIDTGSVDMTALDPDAPVCVFLAGDVVGNVYFAPCQLQPGNTDQNQSYVLAQILGYMERDYLFYPPNTTWTSPSCFSLDWPTYVLVAITEPVGNAHTEHTWGTDNAVGVWKALLYPSLRLERNMPLRLQLPDLKVVNRLKIAIYNPDHTLYQMHGKPWSGSINMLVVEKRINQICY